MSKPPIFLIGMWGLGDNLHQRAVIRELMKTHRVWLDTCHYQIYHDLVAEGLNLVFKATRLRAQAKTIVRERALFKPAAPPPPATPRIKLWYHKHEIDQYGSILDTLLTVAGVPNAPRDFTLPIPNEWRMKAWAWLNKWAGKRGDKPLMLYRPIVIRREWDSSNRNPDPDAYAALYNAARAGYFTVSIADIEPGIEDIVGPAPEADVTLHKGELDFPTMAALFAEADCGFFNAGFAPVLAQAVGLPAITVYGGRESFQTTQRAGAHLAPTLGINPIRPCDCHTNRHTCDKRIDVEAALPRVREFASSHQRTRERAPMRTLIFGTTYVDCDDRAKLTRHWIHMHGSLNPDCDLLLVDSASPISVQTIAEGTRCKVHDFGDNVGHLARKGKDGWGRAFTFGLQYAIDNGYDYVFHIEGDSLFRLPVMPVIADMARRELKVITTPVTGMRRDMPGWIETGLICFSTAYLKRTDFIAKYDWPARAETPTPEIVISKLIAPEVTLMPWKAWRGDKQQISHQNVLALNLDWVTHCHRDAWVYDRFAAWTLKGEGIVPATTPAAPAVPATPEVVKVNLGCGDNKLPGWKNHDADVDIRRRLPWRDGTVDFILCEHCVEHVSYHQAIFFFREAFRVLKPGGVLRVVVPSIEQIFKAQDLDYWQFTTKFQPNATLRGALENIVFKHGHQQAWTATLLEPSLYLAGFTQMAQREVGASEHPELTGVEGHGKAIGEAFNRIESLVMEATKGGARGIPATVEAHRRALIVGGAMTVASDLAAAERLLEGRTHTVFAVNDQIAVYPGPVIAVSLHPEKINGWLDMRRDAGLPEPLAIWAHKNDPRVTRHTEDWSGSSGLFAVKVARELGFNRILLAGVPMQPEANNAFRPDRRWNACEVFRRAWEHRHAEIAPYTRSLSGWTAQRLGMPDADFMGETDDKSADVGRVAGSAPAVRAELVA